jgi:hypothetical protein
VITNENDCERAGRHDHSYQQCESHLTLTLVDVLVHIPGRHSIICFKKMRGGWSKVGERVLAAKEGDKKSCNIVLGVGR